MPIDAANLTTKVLQATLFMPPVNLNAVALRTTFSDLARFDYDTFVPAPDGGAIISQPKAQKQIIIAPGQRQITSPIILSSSRNVDEVVDAFGIVEAHFPISTYVAMQIAVTSHLPVTAETASDLIDRTIFNDRRSAINALGPGRVGTGVRVFFSAGQGSVALEPLFQDPGTIFVQYVTLNMLSFQAPAIRGMLESAFRYNDSQVRDFAGQMLAQR